MPDVKRKRGGKSKKQRATVQETLDSPSTATNGADEVFPVSSVDIVASPSPSNSPVAANDDHHRRRGRPRKLPKHEKPEEKPPPPPRISSSRPAENGGGEFTVILPGGDSSGGVARVVPAMDAVVKVFCVHTEPNFSLPWQRKRQYSSSSSGFVIGGRRVLTNAHSVEHYTQVKLKKRGSDTKYLATVLAIGTECDIGNLLMLPSFDF